MHAFEPVPELAQVAISTGVANQLRYDVVREAAERVQDRLLRRVQVVAPGTGHFGEHRLGGSSVGGVGVGGFRRAYAELVHLKGKNPKAAPSVVARIASVTVGAQTETLCMALHPMADLRPNLS